jgi:diaminohydroxyphosphoribosylaminopyrimidine deaminase / 5-amino-6-(5-phosphoribosylamino)uracil reductase
MTPDEAAELDRRFMGRALELARRGEGYVEPNPMVGCVLVRDGQVVGEGWHQRFGGPHAEIEALMAAGEAARGATAYVTLEPCSHFGKTPPCTQALIKAGVERVVIGCRDPNPQVKGRGTAELEAAGIQCQPSVLAEEAADLIAPFTKLATTGRPWVIAKWAMTLDGKIATHAGDSRWISSEESRAIVHKLRGRVDAIVVGRGTLTSDNPRLTARPPGPRVAMRVILDSHATLSPGSLLISTLPEAPVMVAASSEAPSERVRALVELGVQVWQTRSQDFADRWNELLAELGRRQMTNILVEGGAKVFGSLLDAGAIDEVHAFIATRLLGGSAPTAIAGQGVREVKLGRTLKRYAIEQVGGDAYIHGRLS